MKTVAIAIVSCLSVAVVQAALTVTNTQKAKLAQHHQVCSEETKVEPDILKKLLDGNFPENDQFKEYLFCISKKIGFQNEAGVVQKDVIIEKLGTSIEDSSKAKQLTENCVVEDEKPTETVYKIVTCLYNSTPNHIILVH